ncbi:hypothetical protein [Methanosarcina sp. UBA5]|uniref:hypothetical protein n=1 Tax=Methanosarcina sp. UBA5 TaxID=1915593 RepID=UPI0025D3BFBE|nr:hypothetical protein [Methanosarcina sp. UBA5]
MVTIIAKIASGFQKPDGLTVVRPENVREFLFLLLVSKIQGIGEKTADTLKSMGLSRVEELANCDVQILSGKFGKMGLRMKQLANGFDFGRFRKRKV